MKYDICVVFSVHALNDDDALETLKDYLPTGTFPMEWNWIYTTLNKGENE